MYVFLPAEVGTLSPLTTELRDSNADTTKPWGEGPNDLDLDRYCNLLALDLDEIMSHPQTYEGLLRNTGLKTSASSRTLSSTLNADVPNEAHVIDRFSDPEELIPDLQAV